MPILGASPIHRGTRDEFRILSQHQEGTEQCMGCQMKQRWENGERAEGITMEVKEQPTDTNGLEGGKEVKLSRRSWSKGNKERPSYPYALEDVGCITLHFACLILSTGPCTWDACNQCLWHELFSLFSLQLFGFQHLFLFFSFTVFR